MSNGSKVIGGAGVEAVVGAGDTDGHWGGERKMGVGFPRSLQPHLAAMGKNMKDDDRLGTDEKDFAGEGVGSPDGTVSGSGGWDWVLNDLS